MAMQVMKLKNRQEMSGLLTYRGHLLKRMAKMHFITLHRTGKSMRMTKPISGRPSRVIITDWELVWITKILTSPLILGGWEMSKRYSPMANKAWMQVEEIT